MWRIPMKKLLLATAIAALSVSAQAAPTVYGKAFLSVDYDDTSETTSLNSNASRIGLKGSEALTANTDVVYQLEYRVDVDADGQDNWKSRDTYVGLANKQYGTFLAGRLTAIDDHVNFANVTQGGIIGEDKVQTGFDAPRVNNAFAYVSPNYSGLNFMAMYGFDADNDANSLAEGGWGVGAKYAPEGQPFRAGATYIEAGLATGAKKVKAARVSGSFDLNQAVTLGALYQNTANLGAKKENLLTVSGEMKTATPWTAYAQGDFTKNFGGADGVDQTRVVVGGKYAFNKAATGHVYAGAIEPDQGDTQFGFGTGLEYKF